MLTLRQSEVVALVLRGWTNREIAEELEISETRVERHIRTIADKLPGSGRARRRICEQLRSAA